MSVLKPMLTSCLLAEAEAVASSPPVALVGPFAPVAPRAPCPVAFRAARPFAFRDLVLRGLVACCCSCCLSLSSAGEAVSLRLKYAIHIRRAVGRGRG